MNAKHLPLPLNGISVLELMGIGPVPYASQVLADMGAHVIRIEKPGGGMVNIHLPVENRKKSIQNLDLTRREDKKKVEELIKISDILVEGARPGTAEKLGLGPEEAMALNPALIYGRMTGWGQTGPWAKKAGHDINYIGLTGALLASGSQEAPPTPPLNLLGDYGGGAMFLVAGLLAALLQAKQTGKGRVIDAAIIDGTASMMGIVYSLETLGMWTPKRQNNLLDGSRPFYRCYKTRDGGFMAVGCLEEKFFAKMLSALNLTPIQFGAQHDPDLWPAQIRTLEAIFATKTRTQWEEIFETSDACVTPVLSYQEAPNHPQNIARQTYETFDGSTVPAPAPRFD